MYYSIDDGEYIELLDFSTLTNYFDVPLTIGASLNQNGLPQRYFIGTISNIEVKFIESDAQLSDY